MNSSPSAAFRRVILSVVTVFVATAPLARHAFAGDDPELTLQAGEHKVVFKRSDLLKRKDVESLTIDKDPAYPGQKMQYKAVPASALFASMKIADDAVIQFKCLDGFSAPISKERLLNTSAAMSLAFIAIEEADKPWPALKPGGASAGPFYLVWPKPEP